MYKWPINKKDQVGRASQSLVPRLWNSLQLQLRFADSEESFKKQWKYFFLIKLSVFFSVSCICVAIKYIFKL